MKSSLFCMEGKVAVITGASRGIGEAIATRFAEAGAAVVLAARKADGLEVVAERIRASGGRALAIATHAGKLEEVRALMRGAVNHFGHVDVLVNNAAANPCFGPMLGVEEPAWDKTFEVNVKGAFMLSRELVEHLHARKAPGTIINVASAIAIRAAPYQGVYAMTKAALMSMTLTLAQELGPSGIRVNCIAPGLVDTRFGGVLVNNPEHRNRIVSKTALGRYAQPDEISGAALYFASNASSYVTGQVLVVDGGATMTT